MSGPRSERRPLIERIGMALVALVIAGLFGAVAIASWTAGALFLAVMSGVGGLMTVWAAMITLRRG